MAADCILALDLGTTGNRAIVFDRQQRVLASAYREFPQIFPQPGWVEHDPETIWESTREVAQQVLQQVEPERVACIGITNQRETAVIWERKSGKPIHNAIVWQDRRTAGTCQQLRDNGYADTVRDKTGLVIDAYFSGTKFRWLLDNVPGARGMAARGELAAGTIDTWIVNRLTDGEDHITDPSNASRTMLFNLHDWTWDPTLCELLGVPPDILPTVVASSGSLGVTSKQALGHSIPICGIIGDQQAALFGQGCLGPGVVKNTYGTGLFFLMNTADRIESSRNLLTTVAWELTGRRTFAVEGSVFIGGAAIQWLRDQLGIIARADDAEALATSVESTGDVYFVPALVGLGAPYWDPHARGTLVGLTRGTGRAHIVRAALEAIAWQTRDELEAMKQELGIDTQQLQVDGGAACNNFLMQFQADCTGVPVQRPKVLETTALGAAGMAGLAEGIWKSPEEFAALRSIDRVFTPQWSADRRDIGYARWLEAVRRSRNWAVD
ncbi:MAG: glycerol kinase GlpK [Candidatus Xenobia bacterium]